MDNEIIQCYELLKRRGFSFEEANGKCRLLFTDKDQGFLDRILRKHDVGYVDECGFVSVVNVDKIDTLTDMFEECKRGKVGGEDSYYVMKWMDLQSERPAEHFGIEYLEANIARYIVAINLCGIVTGGCCDGNHPNTREMYIDFCGLAYLEFHKVMWDALLKKYFKLVWNVSGQAIRFRGDKNKQYVYDELNRVATFIQKNAEYITRVRVEAAKSIDITSNINDQKSITLFVDRARELFGEYEELME